MYLLIAYDTPSDKRRRKIDMTLSEYGVRVNYSVFEVEVTQTVFPKLKAALEKYTDPKADNIRVYRINRESLKKSFVLHSEEEVFTYEARYI